MDAAEQTVITAERHIAQLRAIQLEALEVLDQSQVATGDGARTLVDWVAARVDVSKETARDLVQTMRWTRDRTDLQEPLAEGDTTFDRVVAASRITTNTTAASDPLFSHLDVTGVHREAARRTPVTPSEEQQTFRDRFLYLQPSLDESWWRLHGGLDGALGAIVDQAISQAADQLPTDPEAPQDSAWRKATALGVLLVGDTDTPSQLSVFLDTDQAVSTNGAAGICLQAGPKVGRTLLEAILCDSVTQVFTTTDGEPMRYGRRSRTIPPALRRAVIHRDHNRCAIAGCGSRNRLQVHHIVPWSQGGATDPENLITLCWYHHHIAVHQHGLTPTRHPKTGRWELTRNARAPPDPR